MEGHRSPKRQRAPKLAPASLIHFVNGQLAGESHDWQVPAVFDLKPFRHPGENTIAVAVANWGGPGGLNKGVTLEFQ